MEPWTRRLLLLSALGPVLAAAARGAERRLPTPHILPRIRAHRRGLALWWVGNAGWLVKSDELLLGIDLDLEMDLRIHRPPVSAEELAGELDLAFATHHHADHFNLPTLKKIAAGERCTFVLPRTCLKEAAAAGLPETRIVVPRPRHPFELKGVRVEPLHAVHGNQMFTVLTREPDFVESIASNCGYLLTVGGRRLFHPGDSVLTEEHLELRDVDVLFVSPTVHNMYVDRSAILIEALRPGHVFPQHFGTYREDEENRFWTKGYPDELRQALSPELRRRYHKLEQGEMFRLD